MTINEKWILVEDQKPELIYTSEYPDAGDGDMASEAESDRVMVLSMDGKIGVGFYNEYTIKGEDEPRSVFLGSWFTVEERETGKLNAKLQDQALENLYAWQPLPAIYQEED